MLITLDRRQAVWCGLLSGLLMLTRPNAYLVVLIAAIALWRSVGVKRGPDVGRCVGAGPGAWMVRNLVQVGTPRLTTSEGFNRIDSRVKAIY